LRSRSSSRRRRRCSSFCAVAWSFQKSGSDTRCSMDASSSAGRAASKMAPQIGGAARQVLVSAKLFVEGCGHGALLYPEPEVPEITESTDHHLWDICSTRRNG